MDTDIDLFTYLWSGNYDKTLQLLYLTDWKHCLMTGKAVGGIKWSLPGIGCPFIKAVPPSFPPVYGSIKEAADHTLTVIKGKSCSYIIRLILSTYPMLSSNRYIDVDLEEKALLYKKYFK